MEENKKDLLGKLYALRAGLSALSLECVRLRTEDDRAKSVHTRIEDNTAQIINYKSIHSTSKKTYKSAKHDYNKAKRQYDKKSFPLWCWTIAFLCFAAAALYVCYLSKSAVKDVLLYNVTAVALGIGALFSGFKAAVIYVKLRPLKKKMHHAREVMRDSKLWIEESESGTLVVKEENRELKDTGRDLDASRDSAFAISLPFAKAIGLAIKETFCKLLDESYYGALDFIICQIKDGAADDVPAALLGVAAKVNLGALDEVICISHEKIKPAFDCDIEELSEQIGDAISELEKNIISKLDGVISKIDKGRLYDFGGAGIVRDELEKSCRKNYILKAFSACTSCTSLDLVSYAEYIAS